MTNKLQELYEAHVLMGMRKQRHLATMLGEHSWQYDPAAGNLAFSPGPTFAAQLLGNESAESETWNWAWALEEFPVERLQAALRLRALGEELGVEEFTLPQLPREQLPAHLLGPVALALLEMPAYYRGARAGSNGLYLICDPAAAATAPLKGTEFVATLGDAIASCKIPNHRLAVAQFMVQLGWEPKWVGDAFEVKAEDGVMVLAQFDGLNRLARLSTRAAQPA